MNVFYKIMMFVLMLGVFSACSEEEELPPGASTYHYSVTVSDSSGADLLDPDNASNVRDCLSLVIDGKEIGIYREMPKDIANNKIRGVLQLLEDDCWALCFGPYWTFSERTLKVELTIKGVKYNIKSVVTSKAMEGTSGRLIYEELYLNGELLELPTGLKTIHLII